MSLNPKSCENPAIKRKTSQNDMKKLPKFNAFTLENRSKSRTNTKKQFNTTSVSVSYHFLDQEYQIY